MATRPDKQKVIDEVWDDERVQSFLDREPPDAETSRDFFRLWQAYQAMRPGDFRRFLRFFTEAGGDLDAPDRRGRTVADFIAPHRHATDFVEALVAHGARAPRETAGARQDS
jgi:hypothetical protein